MKVALGSDERGALTDALVKELRERGHEVELVGAVSDGDPEVDWPLTSARVARAVAEGRVDQGIVCCWTGTGASIAANKVRGIRAALCHDAETAKGARRWNDANVLALSLRATAPGVAREILDAWFGTPADADAWNQEQLTRLRDLEGDAAVSATPIERDADAPPNVAAIDSATDKNMRDGARGLGAAGGAPEAVEDGDGLTSACPSTTGAGGASKGVAISESSSEGTGAREGGGASTITGRAAAPYARLHPRAAARTGASPTARSTNSSKDA